MSKKSERILLDTSRSAHVKCGEKGTIVAVESFMTTGKYFKAGYNRSLISFLARLFGSAPGS